MLFSETTAARRIIISAVRMFVRGRKSPGTERHRARVMIINVLFVERERERDGTQQQKYNVNIIGKR